MSELLQIGAFYVCKAGQGEEACACAAARRRPCEAMEKAAQRIFGLIGAPIDDLALIRRGEARIVLERGARARREIEARRRA